MIVESLQRDRIRLEQPYVRMRELLGHKPVEVTVGAFLGVFLGALFNLNRLSAQIDWATALPGHRETIIYAAIFGVMIVAGWITSLVLAQRYKKSRIMAEVSRSVLSLTQTVGWLGVVVAFGQFQHLPYLSYRIWSWVLFAVFVAWGTYLLVKFWKVVPDELIKEREERRKKKWFQRGKKKK